MRKQSAVTRWAQKPIINGVVTHINGRKINGFHWDYFTLLIRGPVAPLKKLVTLGPACREFPGCFSRHERWVSGSCQPVRWMM